MNAANAYARILELGLPTLHTSDVAALLKISTPAASMQLARLAKAGLVTRMRPGLWLVDTRSTNRYALAEALSAPMPSYVSLQTALYLHQMIEQVPAVVYAVSLARTQRVTTPVATYSFHHVAPELFDGFVIRSDGARLATPEKALFDVAYLSGGRSRMFTHLPELELPAGFRETRLRKWLARIPSARRRTTVENRLDTLLVRARHGTDDE